MFRCYFTGCLNVGKDNLIGAMPLIIRKAPIWRFGIPSRPLKGQSNALANTDA
jgi:hypothetical protein